MGPTDMQTDTEPPATDPLQQYARDVNCLSDADRTTRKRALTRLASSVASLASDVPTLCALWDRMLREPLLMLLSDQVEKLSVS